MSGNVQSSNDRRDDRIYFSLPIGMRKKLFLQVDRQKRSSQSDLFPYSPFFLTLPAKLGVNEGLAIDPLNGKSPAGESKLPSKSVLLIMAKVRAKCLGRQVTFSLFFFFVNDRHRGPITSIHVALYTTGLHPRAMNNFVAMTQSALCKYTSALRLSLYSDVSE